MTTAAEIEPILSELSARLESVDPNIRRAVIPDRRVVEAYFTDIETSFYAILDAGELGPIQVGPPDGRSDIRLVGTSEDLLAMAAGDLRFRHAYVTGRVKVEASLADMLRFAAVVPVR